MQLVKVNYRDVKTQLAPALMGYDPEEELSKPDSACYLWGKTALLLRLERRVLVVVALAGELAQTAKYLFERGKSSAQIDSIRFHTKRIAERRFLGMHGIEVVLLESREDEYVLGANFGG